MDNEEIRRTILLIDDDEDIRLIFARGLHDAGFTVRTAADGREAVRFFETQIPDVVVTDMSMPNASGLTVIDEVRRRQGKNKVIIVAFTGVDAGSDLWAGKDWGWDAYIQKPATPDEVADKINALIARGTKATPSRPKPKKPAPRRR